VTRSVFNRVFQGKRGIPLWGPKRPSKPETEDPQDSRRRLAAGLSIAAAAVTVLVALVVFWPSPASSARKGLGAFEGQKVEIEDDEAPSSAPYRPSPPRAVSRREVVRPSPVGQDPSAPLPDPQEFFSELVQLVWNQTGSPPKGVRIATPALSKMRELLLAAFPQPPTDVEVLYQPPEGSMGLFTLKITDEQGREGIFGVRLVPLPGGEAPWELESFVVLEPVE
jgi:hypothetical protein